MHFFIIQCVERYISFITVVKNLRYCFFFFFFFFFFKSFFFFFFFFFVKPFLFFSSPFLTQRHVTLRSERERIVG